MAATRLPVVKAFDTGLPDDSLGFVEKLTWCRKTGSSVGSVQKDADLQDGSLRFARDDCLHPVNRRFDLD